MTQRSNVFPAMLSSASGRAFIAFLYQFWFWLCTKSIDTWKRGVAVLAAALAAG
jgi:hypothetical protein